MKSWPREQHAQFRTTCGQVIYHLRQIAEFGVCGILFTPFLPCPGAARSLSAGIIWLKWRPLPNLIDFRLRP